MQFNSNYDSLNNKCTKGGELYLDLNTIISNKNHIGGGSKSFVNEDCATLCSNDKGGARHYLVSATSSDVKLNASDHCVGGGTKRHTSIQLWKEGSCLTTSLFLFGMEVKA